MVNKESITKAFKANFDQDPEVISQAPGRINIIGEHTDYNDGFVLPAAIDQHTTIAIAKRNDRQVVLFSVLFDQEFQIGIDELKPQKASWTNYILGVVDQLIKRDYKVTGFNLAIDGNVPLGAGLSSSASVECATALGLSELYGLGIAKMEIAQIGQLAEHTFPGVKCGIMDQFASVFGKKDHAVRLDCRDLSYHYVPLKLGDYALLLLNTNVEHSLASSAYNDRREACEKAVKWVAEHHGHVKALRDVTTQMLDDHVRPKDMDVFVKAGFVVKEIERVAYACEALDHGNLKKLGALMYETHDGLSKDYEVSCDELDFLVDFVKNIPEVLGARVMGGGFGGCTLNLVKKDFMDELIAKVSPAYEHAFNLKLTPIKVNPSVGAKII